MPTKLQVVGALVSIAAIAGAVILSRFAIFVAPYAWTGEPARLANLLGLAERQHIADIGAGDGALALEMARIVGPGGVVYATDLAVNRQRQIAERVRREGLSQVRVVPGLTDGTNLQTHCCDAIYIRAVFHHIDDPRTFAESVVMALKPGGRVAVIDFPPGGLWFHGRDHGVPEQTVIRAFEEAGLSLTARIESWGGGMFLLLFTRASGSATLHAAADGSI